MQQQTTGIKSMKILYLTKMTWQLIGKGWTINIYSIQYFQSKTFLCYVQKQTTTKDTWIKDLSEKGKT